MRLLAPLAAGLLLLGCAGDTLVSSEQIAEVDVPRDIKYGTVDGDGHPMVGLMVAQLADGTPMWRCSGTLISPTVFLTAGHCTYGAEHVEIWFDGDVAGGRPGNQYPFTGEIGGMPYTHPDYSSANFVLADVGVVVLETPIIMDHYASLPSLNALDAFATRRGQQERTFTAVGYGLQFINPVFVQSDLVRMKATPHLIQINGGIASSFSLLLSNNASTGGTCFGDSGGPNFIGSSLVVGGVTSFGINGNCAGTGGVYRMDRAAPLEWVQDFLE
jgi:hypothetical protein